MVIIHLVENSWRHSLSVHTRMTQRITRDFPVKTSGVLLMLSMSRITLHHGGLSNIPRSGHPLQTGLDSGCWRGCCCCVSSPPVLPGCLTTILLGSWTYNRNQVLTYGYGTWIYSHYAVLFVYFCLTGEPLVAFLYEAVLSDLVCIYVLSDTPRTGFLRYLQ